MLKYSYYYYYYYFWYHLLQTWSIGVSCQGENTSLISYCLYQLYEQLLGFSRPTEEEEEDYTTPELPPEFQPLLDRMEEQEKRYEICTLKNTLGEMCTFFYLFQANETFFFFFPFFHLFPFFFLFNVSFFLFNNFLFLLFFLMSQWDLELPLISRLYICKLVCFIETLMVTL